MRNLDPLEHRLDAFVHLAQRFADVAAIALVALAAYRHARSDEERSIDRANHFKGRNGVCRTCERVTTVCPVLRLQQTRFRQALQDLCQSLMRDAVRLCNILRTA